MDTQFFNLLVGNGAFGALSALFLYLWQRAESDKKDLHREMGALRDAYEVKAESHTKALTELQEKRLSDMLRLESIVVSNTTAMNANSGLVQNLLIQRGK